MNILITPYVSNDGGWSTINPEARIGIVLAISRNGGRTTIAWNWGRLGLTVGKYPANGSSVEVPSVAGGSLKKLGNPAGWISNRLWGWKHPLPFRGRFKGRSLYPGRSFYFVMIFKDIFMVSLCCGRNGSDT